MRTTPCRLGNFPARKAVARHSQDHHPMPTSNNCAASARFASHAIFAALLADEWGVAIVPTLLIDHLD